MWNLTQLFDLNKRIQELRTAVLTHSISPSEAGERLETLKAEVFQNWDNIVDIVVALAREARDEDE